MALGALALFWYAQVLVLQVLKYIDATEGQYDIAWSFCMIITSGVICGYSCRKFASAYPHHRLRNDIAVAILALMISLAMLAIFSRSSLFAGQIGQAIGALMVANVMFAVLSTFKRLWLTSIALGLTGAFCWYLVSSGG